MTQSDSINANGILETIAENPDEHLDKKDPVIIDIPDTYKRMGFYAAIHECGNKYELDRLVAENQRSTQRKIESIDERFKPRIDWHKSQLVELEKRLLKEQESKDIHARLEVTRAALIEAYIKLGEEKRDLIEKRLEKFTKEIEVFFKAQDKMYDDWRKINEKMFSNNKPGLDVTKKRAEDLRDQFQQRYKGVQEQLIEMDKSGVDNLAFRYLLGNGMALAAGWFFSVYLLVAYLDAKGISNEDVWFFLINSILSALDKNPWLALGQIAIFIGLVGLAALISHVLLYRLDKVRNSQNFGFNLEKGDENEESDFNDIKRSFHFNIKTDSLYALWLNVFPVLIGLGLLFITLRLALPDNSVEIEKRVRMLDISIAGQLIGTITAYVSASLFFLFIAKITDLKKINWVNYVTIGIALLTPVWYFFNLTPQQIALTGFIYSVTTASIPIAFGIRYRGLRRISDYLNIGLDYFARVIAKYSTPFPIGLFSKNFRIESEKMEEELLDWIRSKNQGVRNMQDAPITTTQQEKKEKFIKGLWKDIVDSLGLSEKPKNGNNKSAEGNKTIQNPPANGENAALPELNDDIKYRIHTLDLDTFEKHNFPDYDKKITALKHEYDEIRTQNQIAARRITEIEKEIESTVDRIFELRRNNTNTAEQALFQGMLRKVCILEGFELGHWYLENKIFPERVCPPIYKLPPTDSLKNTDNGASFPSSDGRFILRFSINEIFDEYKIMHLERILNYIESVIGVDIEQPNVLGVERGSVVVKLEMSRDAFRRFITFLDEKAIQELGVSKIDFYSTSGNPNSVSLADTDDNNKLNKIANFLKEVIAEDLNKGVCEIKRILNSSSDKYNEFLLCNSRFNVLKSNNNNGVLSYSDQIEERNKILLSFFSLIDKISLDDINKFLINNSNNPVVDIQKPLPEVSTILKVGENDASKPTTFPVKKPAPETSDENANNTNDQI